MPLDDEDVYNTERFKLEDTSEEDAEEEEESRSKVRKTDVLAAVSDLVSDLLDRDRQGDEQVPQGAIEELVEAEELTVEEIVEHFKEELESVLS